jgi:hypothetical protein
MRNSLLLQEPSQRMLWFIGYKLSSIAWRPRAVRSKDLSNWPPPVNVQGHGRRWLIAASTVVRPSGRIGHMGGANAAMIVGGIMADESL